MEFSTPEELEKIAQLNELRMAKMQEVAALLPSLVGEGEAANGAVVVTVGGGSALRELRLNPRVMRMASEELAEHIVTAAQAASEDLQRKIEEAMSGIMDDSPFDYLTGKVDPQVTFSAMKESFQQSVDEIMSNVEKLKKDLM